MKRKAKAVTKDKFDILGPLMNDIGRELADIVGGDPNGVFLYAEIGDRWDSPNVFKDEGDVVRNYDPSFELSKLLWQAWRAESSSTDKKMRWSVMEYEIKDGKFSVSFRYPDEVDVENMDEDRREVALKARYGDKPIVYPPMPDGSFELQP